jgi:hypothetical protein
VLRDLADREAEGILLGCTEIDLLVGATDSPVPVFDTTRLHDERAVELALSPSASYCTVIASAAPSATLGWPRRRRPSR